MQWFDYLYIMIPCYVANMAPVLSRGFPWNAPVDVGLKWKGRRILGSHKTWRGLFFGVLSALLAGLVLSFFYWPLSVDVYLWSFLTGFGALFGDMLKSFFKRRISIRPGASWFPFDQVDFTVGAIAFGSFVFFPGWLWSLFIVAVSLLGHIAVNHAAFYLGIRKEKW